MNVIHVDAGPHDEEKLGVGVATDGETCIVRRQVAADDVREVAGGIRKSSGISSAWQPLQSPFAFTR